jgi:ferric-dicitrate binding protein FerR (iron transport regulator)
VTKYLIVELKAFRDKLRKYLSNQANEAEQMIVDTWYDSFETQGAAALAEDEKKTEMIRKSIQQGIDLHIKKERTSHTTVIAMRLMRVAAIVVIVAGAALFLFKNTASRNNMTAEKSFCEVRTKAAEMKQIELPDHSHIWINSASVVRYDSITFTNNRNIYLDEGEAFFDVAKDKKHPFTVIASKISTRVLGTSFNVKSYKNLAYAAVDVKTGKVEVSNNNTKGRVLLTANQGTLLDTASGNLAMTDDSAEDIASWIKGNYFLKEVSFSDLNLFFQNQYGVKLATDDEEVANAHYTINIIEGSSLLKSIELICNIHNNKYRRSNNEITIY